MIFINTCDVGKKISKNSEYNSCFKHFNALYIQLELKFATACGAVPDRTKVSLENTDWFGFKISILLLT